MDCAKESWNKEKVVPIIEKYGGVSEIELESDFEWY